MRIVKTGYGTGVGLASFDSNGNLIFTGSTAPLSTQYAIGRDATHFYIQEATGATSIIFKTGTTQDLVISTTGALVFANRTLAGLGFQAIVGTVVAATRSTTFTNAINYTPAASQLKFRIVVNQIITATTGTTIATLGYTDASGTARSLPITFTLLGSVTPTIAPAANGVYSGSFEFDIDASATPITLTFTVSATATYWPSAQLVWLA